VYANPVLVVVVVLLLLLSTYPARVSCQQGVSLLLLTSPKDLLSSACHTSAL
jgi:hypothetical protein